MARTVRPAAPKTRAARCRLKVHVINLDRTPDRLRKFRTVNAHIKNMERVSAVDGQKFNMADLVKQGLVTADILQPEYYTVGAVGNAMSHVAMWNRAIETGKPITVAEDDTVFNFRFERCAADVLESLPPDWDYVHGATTSIYTRTSKPCLASRPLLRSSTSRKCVLAPKNFSARPSEPKPIR
jgi:GR25 family glycosyltransferase involved in LPS biosynthesis